MQAKRDEANCKQKPIRKDEHLIVPLMAFAYFNAFYFMLLFQFFVLAFRLNIFQHENSREINLISETYDRNCRR